MNTRTALPLVLTALALVPGCGDDDAAPAAPAAAAKQDSAQAPYGTYTREMTKADLRRTDDKRPEYGPGQGPPPPGKYRLTVAQGPGGDVLKVGDPGGFVVAMNLEAGDGLLELPSYVDLDKGTFCGPEAPIEASYRFETDGDALQLEASPPDGCADRDSILTGTWQKG